MVEWRSIKKAEKWRGKIDLLHFECVFLVQKKGASVMKISCKKTPGEFEIELKASSFW